MREWNDAKFATFVLPGNDGKPAPVFAGGSNIGISKAESRTRSSSRDLLRIIFSPEYQQMLGKAGLGPANADYVSSLGTDQFAKALIDSASNSKLTPAAPGWAAVESKMILEEFFGKIRDAADLAGARRGVRRQDHADPQPQVTALAPRRRLAPTGQAPGRGGRTPSHRPRRATAPSRKAPPMSDRPARRVPLAAHRPDAAHPARRPRLSDRVAGRHELPALRHAPAVRSAPRVGGPRQLRGALHGLLPVDRHRPLDRLLPRLRRQHGRDRRRHGPAHARPSARPSGSCSRSRCSLAWAMPVVTSMTVWIWIVDWRRGVLNWLLTRLGGRLPGPQLARRAALVLRRRRASSSSG